jgi:hypothetical protein
MFAATVLALGKMFYFTSNIGLTSAIRKDIMEASQNVEKGRSLFDQYLRYSLDRSMLFAGMGYVDDSCGLLNRTGVFPYIPALETEPMIGYWKNMSDVCIPSENQIRDKIFAYMNVFQRVPYDKMGITGTAIISDLYIELTKVGDDKFIGELVKPYLQFEYDIDYNSTIYMLEFTDRTYFETIETEMFKNFYIEDVLFKADGFRYYPFSLYDVCEVKNSACGEVNGLSYTVTSEEQGGIYKFAIYEGCYEYESQCKLGTKIKDNMEFGHNVQLLDGIFYEVVEADGDNGTYFTLE